MSAAISDASAISLSSTETVSQLHRLLQVTTVFTIPAKTSTAAHSSMQFPPTQSAGRGNPLTTALAGQQRQPPPHQRLATDGGDDSKLLALWLSLSRHRRRREMSSPPPHPLLLLLPLRSPLFT